MKRKKKSGSGGANWMDTYGDMVTLLLCFFVMLFSMSKMDESKWIALVQALNPSAVVNGTSMEEPPEGSVVTQDQVDRDMEQLYQAMAEYFQQENMMEKVSIGKGNGYVFISFNDTVFFRPNEYTLLDEARKFWTRSPDPLRKWALPSMRSGCWAIRRRRQPMRKMTIQWIDSWRPIGPQWSLYICRRKRSLTQQGWSVWDMASGRPISSNAIPEERAKNQAGWS